MKKFEIPEKYKASIIGEIKEKRKSEDRMKKDFSPSKLEFDGVEFVLARHFGFCYGVENAVEKVTTLSGYTFQYIDSEEMMTGLIAQEVEEVLPEAVYATTTHDGVPTKGLRYANMMGLIVEAIKDLRDEIEVLKNQ